MKLQKKSCPGKLTTFHVNLGTSRFWWLLNVRCVLVSHCFRGLIWIKTLTRATKLLPQLQCPHGPSRCLALVTSPCSDEAWMQQTGQPAKPQDIIPTSWESGQKGVTTALLCTTKTFPWWECQILLLIRAGSLLAITSQTPPPSPEARCSRATTPGCSAVALWWPH